MKFFIPIFFLLFLSGQSGKAQDSMPEKAILFRTVIKDKGAQLSKGYLYAITDSAVLISQERQALRFYLSHTGMEKIISLPDIEYVKIHRKASVGRSVIIGAAIGVFVGAVVGFAGGDDPKDEWFALTAGEKALSGGLGGGVLGALTGMLIGFAAHKTFIIHGRKDRFDEMRNRMMSRTGM